MIVSFGFDGVAGDLHSPSLKSLLFFSVVPSNSFSFWCGFVMLVGPRGLSVGGFWGSLFFRIMAQSVGQLFGSLFLEGPFLFFIQGHALYEGPLR